MKMLEKYRHKSDKTDFNLINTIHHHSNLLLIQSDQISSVANAYCLSAHQQDCKMVAVDHIKHVLHRLANKPSPATAQRVRKVSLCNTPGARVYTASLAETSPALLFPRSLSSGHRPNLPMVLFENGKSVHQKNKQTTFRSAITVVPGVLQIAHE